MPARTPTRRHLAAAKAARSRWNPHADTSILDRDLAVESLAEHVERVVSSAPPLTGEQLDRLRGLLDLPCRDASHADTPDTGEAA